MQIDFPQQPVTGYTPFALGFRPFFLAAGLFVILFFPFWLGLLWQGEIISPYYQDSISWHRHEMLFGYTMAVIAGFLLTAVKNWTNLPTPSGLPLALLVALWLAARIAPLTPLPGYVIATLDILFAPILAIAIFIPTWRARQLHNQFFAVILLLIAAANLAIHLELNGITEGIRYPTEQLAPLLMLWILIIMAGRVIPFFIERATQGFERRSWKWIEQLSPISLLLLMGSILLLPETIWMTALFATIIHGIRLSGWYTHQLWREPLIWVLWLGYLWLVLGFGLHALATLGLFPLSSAVHAYYIGALGVLSLGMMARVAIGHSGRMMQLTHRSMAYAFALVNLAALIRIFGPLLPWENHWPLGIAGTLWLAAFIIFTWVYAPILMKARIDGRPG